MSSPITATVGQPIKDPTLWGETYGFWTQTVVLLLAAILAWVAIVSSRRIERKKAAIGRIFEGHRDEELTKALRGIAALHEDDNTNMSSFAKKAKINSDESKMIRYALNHFESVSVGIAHGIFDEKTVKSSQYTNVVRLYERTKNYIETIRKEPGGSETNFQDFECLACRWIARPLRKKRLTSIPVRSIRNFLGF